MKRNQHESWRYQARRLKMVPVFEYMNVALAQRFTRVFSAVYDEGKLHYQFALELHTRGFYCDGKVFREPSQSTQQIPGFRVDQDNRK
jgi:hypothetical protein